MFDLPAPALFVGLGRCTHDATLAQEMKKHPDTDLPLVVKPIVTAWKAVFKGQLVVKYS